MSVAAALAIVVFFSLLLPATLALDRREDRARPLYDDALEVAVYQWSLIDDGGRPVPLTLADGADDARTGIRLDDHTEHLQVTVDDSGYCIEARNTFGDETGVLCFEGKKRPRSVLDDRS